MNKKPISLTSLCVVFLALACGRPSPAQGAAVELSGTFLSSQQPVTILVNGFPIYDSGPNPSSSVTYELNAYLKQGSNNIRLMLPRVDLPTPGSNTLMRLHIEHRTDPTTNESDMLFLERTMGRGLTPDNGQPLFEQILLTNAASSQRQIESFIPTNRSVNAFWDADAGSVQHQLIPTSISITDEFRLTLSIPEALLTSLPWEGAPPLLTELDRSSIRTLVTNLWTAIRTNDDTAIHDLLISKIQRFAQGRGTSEEVISNSLVSAFSRLRTATPPYTFDGINPQAIEFVTYPASALVEAKIGGAPPIHAVSASNIFTKRVFLSKMTNEWRIVD